MQVVTVMEVPLSGGTRQVSLLILNLSICSACFKMLMWFLASCGQIRPDLKAKAWWSQQIAWTSLCCVSPGLWMMVSLQGWKVIIHSPGAQHPPMDMTWPAGIWWGGRREGQGLAANILGTPPLFVFFTIHFKTTRFLLTAHLPLVTSHDGLWWWHRPVPLSGARENKVPQPTLQPSATE